jgi:group I intron endonuclease
MIIYKTINILNNKFYVGKDQNNDSTYFGSGLYLKRAIKKYGIKNFRKEILEYCNSISQLNEKEIFWIKELDAVNKGYNIAEGGAGGNTLKGKTKKELNLIKEKHSNAAKKFWDNLTIKEKKKHTINYRGWSGGKNEKLSKQRKGKGNPMFGNSMYKVWVSKYGKQEADRKLNDWKDKVNTPEWRDKISKKLKGRVFSKETIKKMSMARKGKASNAKGKKWMHKSMKNIMVPAEKLDSYINEGWKKGRFKVKKN